MAFLPVLTWVRFLAWSSLGIVIYFAYSMRHSKLAQPRVMKRLLGNARDAT